MPFISRLAVALIATMAVGGPALAAETAPPGAEPVKVMVVALFHMSNPGADLHNVKVDDMLSPGRQAEIATVTRGLMRFQPTAVQVEWPDPLTAERYAAYRAGTLPPSRNEVVQLGFRLAAEAGLPRVRGLDVDGDFPFEPVMIYAKGHGMGDVLGEAQRLGEASVREIEASLASEAGVRGTLRTLNQPASMAADQGFYRGLLRIGGGAEQPGADLLTAWYRRNFLICANILQSARPGDRIVVFYGAGHAFLLRQCIAETPGFELVEPIAYLGD